MAPNSTKEAAPGGPAAQQPGKGKNMIAIFAYLGILIVIPFLAGAKDDPFVKYHLKQGLVLLVFDVVGWVVAAFFGWFPVLGWLLVFLWWIVALVFLVMGIMNVLRGEEKELPWIGQYARSFKF